MKLRWMKGRRKWALLSLGVFAGLLLALTLAAVLILPTAWFRDQLRDRIVYEVERATGGKTEIGAFRFDWKTLTAEVAPFVLHGTEPAGERPLFRAESVKVGVRVISMLRRDVDIAFLTVDQPQINILVNEEGDTNFPEPKIKRTSEKDPLEQLVNLAIGRIELRDGWLRYADRKLPLALTGEDLRAALTYDFKGPGYRGDLSMDKLSVASKDLGPLAFDVATKVGVYKGRIQIAAAELSVGETKLSASGSIENLKSPRVNLDVEANASIRDVGPSLKLPVEPVGRMKFNGKVTYDAEQKFALAGRADGSGLAVREGQIHVAGIGVRSDVRLARDNLELRGTRVNALGGAFAGKVDLIDYKAFKVDGRIEDISVATLSQTVGVKQTAYSGRVSGPIQLSGRIGARDLKAAGQFAIAPSDSGVPVSGDVQIAFDQLRNSVELGQSYIALPSSRLDIRGTLGSLLNVRLESRDLKDLQPAIAAVGDAPEKLPLTLAPGGSATFDGSVTGELKTARVNGSITLSNFVVQNERVDRLVANLDATPDGARVSSFGLGQDSLRLEGSADIGLHNWKLVDDAAVKAKLKVQGAEIQRLLTSAGQKLPIHGQLSASAEVSGTAKDPRAVITLDIANPVLYDEKLDRARAQIRYAGAGVEVIDGVVEAGTARVLLSGSYQHPVGDYKNGRIQFDLSTQRFALDRLATVRELRPGLQGRFFVKATGSADVRRGELQPDKLDGFIALRELVVDGRAIGSFNVDANTSGPQLELIVTGNLRGSKIGGKGAFQLAGDYPGSGTIEFSPIALSAIEDLAFAREGREPLPLEGSVEGNLTFTGPAKTPELMRARLTIPKLTVAPSRRGLSPEQVSELTLRNNEPMILEYNGKSLQLVSAHLVGRETNLRVGGAVNLNEKAPWDLRVDGDLNLGVAQNLDNDIVSSGAAVISASVRGSLQDPQVLGRVELKDAAFSLTDVPNGLDHANGVILFDRRRATIEKLTAETGGGNITLGGFVGFGPSELSYQLNARADNVRIRYPEGTSTAVSSNLSLTGTTSKSMLTGVVTVRRAGFNPRTDIGSILASSARPVATPGTPNPYLRGMQLDVRVESAPNLQLQTALTSDLQAEVDLRVRGTASNPTLLGRIVVNQGDVQFFGNKYTINRGEISFYNQAKIEPVLDMDLETRVRGVLVSINFAGPLSKLNVSYRSDPPLQSTEIIALLAVGRAPGTNTSLASGQTVAQQSFLSTGTNSLLGQAVSAPISGRLQRFFGVSKLKIDPQLTGINAVPQARLTVEQQVSRDVTLTYITNLSEANQQIVRLEWDISRNWSVVALREENGAFGVDFFFKRRFK